MPCYDFIDRFSAGVPRELDERQVPEHPVLHSSAASRLKADPRLDESYQGSGRLSRTIFFGDLTKLGRFFRFTLARLGLNAFWEVKNASFWSRLIVKLPNYVFMRG